MTSRFTPTDFSDLTPGKTGAAPAKIVAYIATETFEESYLVERLRNRVSPAFLEETSRYREAHDRRARLFSRVLLLEALAREGFNAPRGLLDWSVSPEGKPAVPGLPPFSISHTYGVAACAIASAPPVNVGIDVECWEPGFSPLRELRSAWCDAERGKLAQTLRREGRRAAETLALAFWTRKEALFKALGTGLTDELLQTDVSGASALIWGRRFALYSQETAAGPLGIACEAVCANVVVRALPQTFVAKL